MSVPPAARPPDRLPRVVWILSAIAICVAVGFGILAPAVPVFARDFGVGRTAAALVVSMFAAARMASAFGVGKLVDIFGARPVLGIGLVIVAASSGVAGLSQTYLQLLLLRGAGGVGSAMFTVASSSVMASAVPSKVRGRAMGAWSGSFLLGSVLGPVVGGPLTAISLRTPFFFYAGTLAVAAIVAFAALPSVPRLNKLERKAAEHAEGIREALQIPAFRVAMIADLAGSWANAVRVAIIPLFVTEALLLSEAWGGYGLAIAAAMNAVLLLPFGRWSDRRGRLGVVLIGGIASAVGMAALSAPPAMWLFVVAMVVCGIGSAAQAVGPSAVLGDVANGRRGSVIASYQVVGDVGAMVGPLAAGGLADLFGYPAAFGLTAVISAVSALFALLTIRRRPAAAPPVSPVGPGAG
jgi:DHA1 family multidrug resistance protein-like MFS transporter